MPISLVVHATQVKPWITKALRLGTLRRMKTLTKTASTPRPKHKKAGLYLLLSHGRDHPQQTMRDLGYIGPRLGSLLMVKTRYAERITLLFASEGDAKLVRPDAVHGYVGLEVIDGMIVHDNKCYGDWEVCYIAEP